MDSRSEEQSQELPLTVTMCTQNTHKTPYFPGNNWSDFLWKSRLTYGWASTREGERERKGERERQKEWKREKESRPRMKKSHSCWPRTAWCVVNVFHKNGMRPLIIANRTKCYSISYCNSPRLYMRLKYMYSVISVKLDWLPGNSKKWTID